MQASFDADSIRQEMLDLLRQQIEVLNSSSGPTDDQLRECYLRQFRLQELRDQLLAGACNSADQGQLLDAA